MEKMRPIEHIFLVDTIKTGIEELPKVDIGILNRYVIYKDREERVNTHRLYLVNLTENIARIPIQNVKNIIGANIEEVELKSNPKFVKMIYKQFPDLKERDLIHSVAFPGILYNIAPYGKRYNQLPKCELIDSILHSIQLDDKEYMDIRPEYVKDYDCEVLIYLLVDTMDIFRLLSHNPYYREHLAYINTLNDGKFTINE